MMDAREMSRVKDIETDIVVIGGGGSGLAAAVSAAEKGAKVILLEKRRKPGGNSLFPGGMFAVETQLQKKMGIDASKDKAFKIAMDFSHWKINPRIFRAFMNKSADTIQWLKQKGVNFTHVIHMYPGAPLQTWHTQHPDNIYLGRKIVKILYKNCEDLGIKVLTQCPAKKILTSKEGDVNGVLAKMEGAEFKVMAKSVIIATGGYAGNKELMKKYFPYYEDYHIYSVPLTGDGLLMAIEIGAATEGLGNALLHPPCYPGSNDIDGFVREPFPIWVNKKGERFIDETIGFHLTECGNAIARQPGKLPYILFDEKVKQRIMEEGRILIGMGPSLFTGQKLPKLEKELQVQAEKGGVKISHSWDEIAKWMGAAPQVLKNTIEEYNSFCEKGYDEIFNKDRRYLQALKNPPYYAVRCRLSFLNTIGGIKIEHHMEVLNQQDNPIPGLYAVGDTAGGWESETYCIDLPGSAFGFAINSGRIAAENAVKYISGN
jgi:fumarate reductase flavoprotein subunit